MGVLHQYDFMEQKNGRVLGKSGEFFFEGLILKLLTI